MAILNSPFEIGTPFLKRRLPQAMFGAANPVFEREVGRTRWFQGRRALWRYGLLCTIDFYAVVVAAVVLLRPWENRPRFYNPIFRWLGPLTSLTFIFGIVVDILYVLSTVTSINSQVESGHWDLLKLTTLHEQDIFAAKYAVAQVRSWRIMLVNRAFQTGALLFSVLVMLFRNLNYARSNNAYGYTSPDSSFIIFILLTTLPTLALDWFAPLWRMRAMTQTSLAVSSRVRSTAFAILAGLASVLVFQMGLYSISMFQGNLMRTLGFFRRPGSMEWVLITALSVALIYGLCRIVQRVGLYYGLRSAFRPE